MTPSVDIIIVNWNAGARLKWCVDSIAGALSGAARLHVVVIDNASSDGSLDGLPERADALSIVRNNHNRGFAAGCNQGAAGSRADYLLFLNPDVVLGRGSLGTAVEFMQRDGNERVGIVGIQLLNEGGDVVRSCARRPTTAQFLNAVVRLDRIAPSRFSTHMMVEWDHLDTREVDHVTGAFFLVRRLLFERLGGFDERFFAYYEDLDFSIRAQEAGWRSMYLADARAVHPGGWSSGHGRPVRLCHHWRSRILYVRKRHGRAPAFCVLLGTIILEPLLPIARVAASRSLAPLGDALRACVIMWRLFARRLQL